MQLTRYTDYGLRTLMYLALKREGELCTLDELSRVYDISRNNLNKIVHQLGKAEIISTKRGKGGGFFLAKPASKINIGKMVRLLENTLNIVNCHEPYCVLTPACHLKHALAKATEAFMATLENYSLADLVEKRREELIQLVKLERE